MNIIEKTILILITIFLIGVILIRSDRRTTEMLNAYENCEPMVDINGNYQMVCK